MESTKVVRLLKTLTKDELNEFEKFISSPYFSRKRDCTPLFKALRSFWPRFGEKASNDAVFEKAYPGKKYGSPGSVSLLSTLSSELYILGLDFLRYSELEKDETQKKLLLLRNLRNKKLQKEFEKELVKGGDENSVKRGSAGSFLENYLFSTVYGQYVWDRGETKELYEALLKSSESALAFALITAYKFMDTKETAKHFNIKPGHTFADIVLESLDSKKMLADLKNENGELYPFIYANHLVYMMNKEPENHEHYNKLKEILDSSLEMFGHTEKYMLYQALETYIVIQLEHTQHKENTGELFNIYKKALALGVHKVSPGGYLEPTVFRNIFIAAKDAGELDWAEEFVNKYSAELPEEFAEGMKDFALANLHFIKGEFEKALKKIINIRYDYPLHKIDAKLLQFKIYYELGNFEQGFNILDTTKHYLAAAENMNEHMRKRYTNFIKFAADLLKTKTGSKKDTGCMMEKFRTAKAVESQSWLLEKMEELQR